MKKRLSHFPYNERSRPGWTPKYLPPKTSEPNPIHHENCYLCPRYVCYPCSRSIHRQDAVEAAWRVIDPVLGNVTPLHEYEPHTWGPAEADAIAANIGGWHNPRPCEKLPTWIPRGF